MSLDLTLLPFRKDREQITALTGRELDAAVAEYVMGWRGTEAVHWGWKPSPEWCGMPPEEQKERAIFASGRGIVPYYSTFIRESWEVVEKLRSLGWLVVLKAMPEGFPFRFQDDETKVHRRYVCSANWMPIKTPGDCRRYIHANPYSFDDSAPLAVCRCALYCILEMAEHPTEETR